VIDFHAAHHSRVGFRAVLIGGASLFNAVSNAKCPMHGCPVGYRDNAGCCTRTWYTVASTQFARALLPKALAGTRWSAMTAPFSISALVHGPLFDRAPVGTSATTESHT